ncbi:MAG: glycosyltransferase family 39 protein, partial [Anaerolineae bacterium]|nr:glycosyltransferase family 39 protein [Phycisphaerae bacterium]
MSNDALAEPRTTRTLPWAIALAVAFFACVAPTLRWLEFSNSMEVLNVGTVLEIHRGSPWLLPTLEGKPRIEKPPLTAWITALATRRPTSAALNDPDPVQRAAAYYRLAFDIRWTALLTGALTLLATYALGSIIARDEQLGFVAAIVCASNYFFLRFTRFATTDMQLMLWVTLANVFIARCVLDRVTWPAALGAGAALGLAFMAKGPVAFVQTLAPAAVYLLIVRAPIRRFVSAPIIVGAIVMLAIAS